MRSSTADQTVDLTANWDASIPLANPHKGWYHHFYDNGLHKYLSQDDSDLTDFPGMDHIYLRLAWSYLEPREGEFRWQILDDVIEKWTGYGLKIAFRITCRETGSQPIEQQFATPRWVKQAGAQGDYYARYKEPGNPAFPWEPVYDDPVFLAKLENFIRAFAARYDGKPWLRYVDIGSLGDWGEGHTSSGSQKKYNAAARLKHLEIHTRYFKKTLLVTTDDYVREAPTEDGREQLHRYVVDHGISYRDDSILNAYWTRRCGQTYSVANPEYFRAVYEKTPTVLETAHLRAYRDRDYWNGDAGTPLGQHNGDVPSFLRGAVQAMRATYIGYHGDARDWMAIPENPQLSNELLNLCGYWYFPHKIVLPDALTPGGSHTFRITWENRGVAPAYHPYKIVFRFSGPKTHTITVDARNRNWLPSQSGTTHEERYHVDIPADLPNGPYRFAFKLYCDIEARPVLLPIREALKDADDFYQVGTIAISSP